MKSVLIANRGEIAVRIIRTAREAGVPMESGDSVATEAVVAVIR